MANEATIITLLGNKGDPMRYTVADGVGISKGSLMVSRDAVTMAKSSGVGEPFVGIARDEKVLGDGSTTLAVYTNVLADIYASNNAINAGSMVMISGANLITEASSVILTAIASYAAILGPAVENGAASEKIAVRVRK